MRFSSSRNQSSNLARVKRFLRVTPKIIVWIIMAWSGFLLFFAAKMFLQISTEPGWLYSRKGLSAWSAGGVKAGGGGAGLVQTGHLWCCHGPFACQRAPFLTPPTHSVESSGGVAGFTMQPGECACEVGYVGDGCQPQCGNCSGHGYCLHPNECSCEPGWIGDTCSEPLCLTPCFKGTCTAPGVCQCHKNYHGPMCDVYCDKHGFFIGDDRYSYTQGLSKREFDLLARTQCKCIEGWEGRWCDEPVCKEVKCMHGFCVAPEKCKCKPGWTGADCNVVPSQGKFLFSEKDLNLQRERKFKEDLNEFKAQKNKLHAIQVETKEKEKEKKKDPAAAWKPSYLTSGGKVQGRGGPALAPKLATDKYGETRRRAPVEPAYRSQESMAQLHRVQQEDPTEANARVGRGGGVRKNSRPKILDDKLPF